MAGAARTGGPTSCPLSPRRRRVPRVCGSTSCSTQSARARSAGAAARRRPARNRPLGRPFSLRGARRRPRRDLGRRRDRGRNAGASAARARAGGPTAGPARLSRSCPRGRAGSLSLLGGGRRPRTATQVTRATSPTCSQSCWRGMTPARRSSTPAGLRRCSRPFATPARPGRCPRSSRSRRRWPAASGPARLRRAAPP